MIIIADTADKYLSAVRRHLKCARKPREGFLRTLRTEVRQYRQEHPQASYEEYVEAFGQPQETAEQYLSDLTRKERFGYWLPLIIALGTVGALLFLYVGALLIDQTINGMGYMIEHLEIVSPATLVTTSDLLPQPDASPQ